MSRFLLLLSVVALPLFATAAPVPSLSGLWSGRGDVTLPGASASKACSSVQVNVIQDATSLTIQNAQFVCGGKTYRWSQPAAASFKDRQLVQGDRVVGLVWDGGAEFVVPEDATTGTRRMVKLLLDAATGQLTVMHVEVASQGLTTLNAVLTR